MTKASKGLGDSIEKVLKKTGIDKVAKKVLGDDCGCEERKQALNKIYNKVFNANKKTSSCGSCVQQTVAQLAKVYVNSCKIENNESDV